MSYQPQYAITPRSRQGAMDLINPLLDAGLVVREGTRKSGHYRLKNT